MQPSSSSTQDPPTIATITTNENHPNRNDSPASTTAPPPPSCLLRNIRCRCGRPARCERVKKYGPTQGLLFWTCDLPQSDINQCAFFLWDNLPEAKRLLFRRRAPTAAERARRRRWSPY
jgi:hypothetical protein